MKRDLRSIASGNGGDTFERNDDVSFGGFDDPSKERIDGVIKEYSSKSHTELIRELTDKKLSGEFSEEDMASFAAQISPMLNSDQKARMNEIINMLKNG